MKRLPELDRLVQSAYGDKVMGRVPENLCVQLLNGYEVERAAKQERRKVLCELLSARREKEQSVDEWLNMMQDYAQLEEVDRPTLVRLIQTQGKNQRSRPNLPKDKGFSPMCPLAAARTRRKNAIC